MSPQVNVEPLDGENNSMGVEEDPLQHASHLLTKHSIGSKRGSAPNYPQEGLELVIDDFSATQERESKPHVMLEGDCYLKTKSERFKKHWAVLVGNELFCYRQKDDPMYLLMHSLAGTFVKDMPEEIVPNQGVSLWPVKIILLPTMSRILYFKTKDEQMQWVQSMTDSIGQANLYSYYQLE
jgi:hypothetical protein